MKQLFQFLREVYTLVRPFGRRRLARVCAAVVLNAVFQVIGVASIFPFLAIAANPARFRGSQLGKFIVELLPEFSDQGLIIFAGCLSIAMMVAANVVSVATEYVRATYAHQVGHWMRVRLLRHILSQPYAYFLQQNTSVLSKKVVGDVMQFVQGVLMPLLEAATRGLIVLLLALTLLAYSPLLTIATLAALALFYYGCFRVLGKRSREVSAAIKAANRGSFFSIGQAFSVIKPMFAADAQSAFVDRFSEHSAEQARVSPRIVLYGQSPRYLLEPLAYGGLIVWVLATVMTGGDLAAVIPSIGLVAMIGYRMMPALQIFFAQSTQIAANMHALEEIQQELAEAGEGDVVPTAASPLSWSNLIVARDLTFRYDEGGRNVLEAVSFEIPHGASVGIVGPTGSGKSTLVDLMLGLLTPTAGEILIDGRPLSPRNLAAWRAAIGYVPQETVLFDGTVEENIAFGVGTDAIDRQRVREAATVAQIDAFVEHELPDGYATHVGERGVRLSGGQRQRLGLARALYRQPSVLVLDEATSALDSATEAALVAAIEALPEDLTVIAIAHRQSTLAGCELLLQLAGGHVGTLTGVNSNSARDLPSTGATI